MQTSKTAPLHLLSSHVKPEWIDYNGHMNVAYYLLAFDLGVDGLFRHIGIDESYVEATNSSSFTLETHITYAAELRLGDAIRISGRLVDHDHKRMHVFLEMYHGDDGYLSATAEFMMMHIDMTTRRSSNYPKDVYERVEALYTQHKSLEIPANVGHTIGIRRKA
jgi:acyl-CoA thioester hydrolase